MNCPYCQELATGVVPQEYGIPVPSRTLATTDHFLVNVDISPLAPGHLLIVPKAHMTCFGAVPHAHRNEFEQLLDRVTAVLTCTYGAPTLLEHGSSSCSLAGGCISHAHLHVFPGPVVLESTTGPLDAMEIESFWALEQFAEFDRPYVFCRDMSGHMFVTEKVDELPRQFIRIAIAASIGLPAPKWNWREHILVDNLRETLSVLTREFT
jgi:diadenosine tetraphosphate (Ap4A) HIT family hydrolase